MNLCIESAVERRGYVNDEDGNGILIMRGRARLVPLLRAIGHRGREILRGAGFNVDGVNSTYEGAVEVLQDYYGRQEMVVNGLRDREVSRDLMKNANVTWELLHEALRAREMANHSDRFVRADSRSTDLKSEVKREVAKVSEFDSRVQYRSNDRDRRYGTRGREYNKDSGSRKYRDNSRERDKGDVGYDRRGSSRRSGGSRDSSYERYGSRDISRERYRGRESPREMRDKSSRYWDKSMDRFEGDKYKERRETSQYDEG
ncbi:serine/threonine-protein kinase fray2-like [Watersipora subatra]|uniref:serine/threonine-protein kinase fray2-like n=1 Tax=Watersipora subatra TaxID=2589382 RepID=UPI00355B17CE